MSPSGYVPRHSPYRDLWIIPIILLPERLAQPEGSVIQESRDEPSKCFPEVSSDETRNTNDNLWQAYRRGPAGGIEGYQGRRLRWCRVWNGESDTGGGPCSVQSG